MTLEIMIKQDGKYEVTSDPVFHAKIQEIQSQLPKNHRFFLTINTKHVKFSSNAKQIMKELMKPQKTKRRTSQ